jgi:P27 family predicted phage terminase small subunit
MYSAGRLATDRCHRSQRVASPLFFRPLERRTLPARRISTTLKIARGTSRADRRSKRDFAARLTRTPSPPAHLSELAATEWRRLAPAAAGLGTLTAADLRAFELLAVTLATEAEAREVLQREGWTVSTADGGSRKGHPAIKTIETARAQAARLLEAFGLTPRGRQALDTSPPLPDPTTAKYFP